jgi:hypothetical protein
VLRKPVLLFDVCNSSLRNKEMNDPTFDMWRDSVSQALGRIEANVTNLSRTHGEHEERIAALETKANKWAGVVVAFLALLPFFADKIKAFFVG